MSCEHDFVKARNYVSEGYECARCGALFMNVAEVFKAERKVLLARLAFNSSNLDPMARRQVIEALERDDEKRVIVALKLVTVLASKDCGTGFISHASKEDREAAANIVANFEREHGVVKASDLTK